MAVKNLVLEVGETETAPDLQRRLNEAAEDGFFLVTVIGRFAFLRTTAAQPKKRKAVVTDNRTEAAIQQRIERVLLAKGPQWPNMLYKLTNGIRDGRVKWNRALDDLIQSGHAGRTEGKVFWAMTEE